MDRPTHRLWPTCRVQPALLVLAAALAHAAVEPMAADLQVAVEARPGAYDYTWDDAGSVHSGADAFERALAVSAGLRWGFGQAASPHALLLGADLVAVDEAAPDGDRRGVMARLVVGHAFGIRPDLTWVSEAGIASGGMLRTIDRADIMPLELSGRADELTVQSGLRWRIGGGLGLHAAGGWLLGRDRLSGDGVILDSTRSGALWTLGLSWTFDRRPRALE